MRELGPEHRRLLGLCRTPAAVADLASETDLPLGVVRVLLGDLRERGLVRVVRAAGRSTPEESVLRSVLDGLRTL
jgi:DNA-binding IclR family transcriptional regulator